MPDRPRNGRRVFVIHGRNQKARNSVFEFLRAVGLQPHEWLSLITDIGPWPTIEQVVMRGIQEADAIVVLLTGDDEVRLRAPLVTDNDTNQEIHLQPQARPNVLFELGVALAVAPTRTLVIQIGKVKSFSDIAGRLIFLMDNEKRHELAELLRAAGCAVDTSGQDWLRAGNFEFSLPDKDDREQLVQEYRAYLDYWLLLPFSSPHGQNLGFGKVAEHMIGLQECIVRRTGAPAGEVMTEIRRRIEPRADIKERRLPMCLVTDSMGQLAGVITPSDLLAKKYNNPQARVEDVWTANPFTVDVHDTIIDGIRRMTETGILSGLPVTRDKFPVGFLPHPGRRELVG